MKISKYKWVIITLLMVIGIMVMIFLFSTQSKESSAQLSGKFTTVVIKILDFIKKYLPSANDGNVVITGEYNYFEDVNYYVRKFAHMTEYALLGGALMFHLWSIIVLKEKILSKVYITYSLAISTLYACSDEIHQIFIAGRGPQVKDVFIDAVGAFIGSIIIYGVIKIKSR